MLIYIHTQLALEQTGLNCAGPFIHGLFSINKCISLPYDFLNDIFIFLAYFIVKIWYIIHIQNMYWSTVYVIGKASDQW